MTRRAGSKQNGSSELSDLKNDIANLRQDLSSLTKHMQEIGKSKVRETREAGADTLDELRDELMRAGELLKQQGDASVAEVERTVQDKPFLSMLAAFGVGMLVTRLLTHR